MSSLILGTILAGGVAWYVANGESPVLVTSTVSHHSVTPTQAHGQLVVALAGTRRGASVSDAESDSRPPRIALGGLAATVDCLKSASTFQQQLACCLAQDLATLGAHELGEWACTRSPGDQGLGALLTARLSQMQPCEALQFVEEFQAACGSHSETNLTVGCVEQCRVLSESWYLELSSCINVGSLLVDSGSDAAIQLAEVFVRAGDAQALTLMQDIGTGALGGSVAQVFRGALISLVHTTDPIERFTYLERIYGTATGDYGRLAHLFAEFLTNGQCWVEGFSTPSLLLLRTVLHDARFGSQCAVQLAGMAGRSVAPADQAMWAELLGYASYLREQRH